MKVVENLLFFLKKKLMMKNSFIELTYVEGEPTTYNTEFKETYFEIYIYQESWPLSLCLLNIPNCQSVLKYLLLYGKMFMFV